MKKMLFVLCFVSIVLGLLLSPGCKKSSEADGFDITGTWTLTISIFGGNHPGQYVFSGSITNGTFTINGIAGANGTYNVTGANVTFTITYDDGGEAGTVKWTFTGSFSSENAMNGDVTAEVFDLAQTFTGTWTATR